MTIKEANEKKNLSLDDLREIDSDFLTPQIAAKFLRCAPYSINLQAMEDPQKLGYRVNVQGKRVRIPRLAFIKFMEG